MTPEGDQPSPNGSDVLASLPRHRPGTRTSRRSAAAGKANGTGSAASAASTTRKSSKSSNTRASGSSSEPKRTSSGSSTRAKRASTRRAQPSRARSRTATRLEGVPDQGFEVEEEVRLGRAVEPPSRFELATSLIEIAGEGVEGLVKASVSAGGSVLKRTLDRLPKP